MNAAEKKTGEVKDALYLANVRADEHVHINAYPNAEDSQVVVTVYPNHWRCAGCRSKGLVQKLIGAITRGSDDYCAGCRAQDETNGFHVRAKVTGIVNALATDFTIVEHSAHSSIGHVYLRV